MHLSPILMLSSACGLFLGLSGCNESGLSGSSSRQAAKPKAAESTKTSTTTEKKTATTPQTSEDETKIEEVEETEAPEETATAAATDTLVDGEASVTLSECLKQWPDHPFSAAQIASAEEVNLDQSNNNNDISYHDDKVSAAPRLVVITISSKNVNAGTIELLDPKGWYCVDVLSKAANNFTIAAACTSVVATLSHHEHVANGFSVQRGEGC